MKEREFDYIKKNGERKHYSIFVLEERDDYIIGLPKEALTQDLQEKVKNTPDAARIEIEKMTLPFRRFIKKNILN